MGDGAEGFPTAVLSQIFCSQILAKQQSEARVLVSFEKKKGARVHWRSFGQRVNSYFKQVIKIACGLSPHPAFVSFIIL